MLEAAREEVGLSQVDLAKRLGKKQPFVSKYEAGRCYLDVTQFILICRELFIDPAEKLKELEARGVGFDKERRPTAKQKVKK